MKDLQPFKIIEDVLVRERKLIFLVDFYAKRCRMSSQGTRIH